MKKRIRRINLEIQNDILNMYINHNHKIIEISKKHNLSHTAVYKVVNEYLGELSLTQSDSIIPNSFRVPQIEVALNSNVVPKQHQNTLEVNSKSEVAEIPMSEVAEIPMSVDSSDNNSDTSENYEIELDKEEEINHIYYKPENFYGGVVYNF